MPTYSGLRGDGAQPLASLQSKCPRQRCCAKGEGSRARGAPRGAGRRRERAVWWAALTCLRQSHRAEGFAVSWCGQEGAACHPGGARWLGPGSVGPCKCWERRGHRDAGFSHTQKSPLPGGSDKVDLGLDLAEENSFPSPCTPGVQLPSRGGRRRGGGPEMPHTQSPVSPLPVEAGQG